MVNSKGEPRYQVPRELAGSLAFRSLPRIAKILWHDMMMSYRGNNNGNINATLHDLKHYGWVSSATVARALAYLIAHGFLCETRNGGGNKCQLRQCCLYRFTHLPVHSNERLGIKGGNATYDHRQFDPSKLPKKITLTSLKGLSEKNSCFGKQSITVQRLKRHALDNKVDKDSKLQEMKHDKTRRIMNNRISKGFVANP